MKTETPENFKDAKIARRSFLRYAGAGAASVGLLAVASCHKDHPINFNRGIDIGSGDTGILNYAYALEQLEAAFYIQVINTPYSGMTDNEKAMLTDIRDHEICHREFFKAALGAKAIPSLTVDFSKINFSDRASVLGAAKAFEDTGVNAYDGAAYLIQSAEYLTLAGKIVSVEARHAAYIRNLLKLGDYAGNDVVDTNGLNTSLTIAQVLPIANTYLSTKVNASNYNYVA
ncbi:MAG: ferritin-like protein [Mucilaginibacter sp.]|nr:ferritin-like protein [Mucilaginibacter sp.]